MIPARGGSKRIPRKNIKTFCGKPMMAWSIEAAKASKLFDHVIVSTDDDEVAATAKQWGAEVPLHATRRTIRATTSALVRSSNTPPSGLQSNSERPDLVCTIYATAPFVRPADLIKGLEVLIASGGEIAFTVTSFPVPDPACDQNHGKRKSRDV